MVNNLYKNVQIVVRIVAYIKSDIQNIKCSLLVCYTAKPFILFVRGIPESHVTENTSLGLSQIRLCRNVARTSSFVCLFSQVYIA